MQTKGNISVAQYKLQYTFGDAMQDNAAQQLWYITIMATNTIAITRKFAKIVHPDFFGEDGRWKPDHCDSEN